MLEPSRNRANGCWQKRSALWKTLIIIGVVLILIIIVSTVLYSLKDSFSNDECASEFLVKASSEIRQFVDFKENPCENFYDYICGTYLKPDVNNVSLTPLDIYHQTFQEEIRSIIVDPIIQKDSHATVLVKQFYQECMNETKIDQYKNQAFFSAIKKLGGWPLLDDSDWNEENFDWIDWDITSKELGLPLFRFFTFSSLDTSKNYSILKIKPNSGDYNDDFDDQTYEQTMKNVLEVLGVNKFPSAENKKVLAFIRKVAKLHLQSFGRTEKKEIDTVENLIEACPSIPWMKLLNGISLNETKFNNSSEVSFVNIKFYCLPLSRLLNNTKPRIIANYFIWSMLHQTYQFLSSDIRKAYEPMMKTNESRHDVCFKSTDHKFRYVKESIYIQKKTTAVAKKQLTEMVDIIKGVFDQYLQKCDWMDEKTKKFALNKARNIKSIIGFNGKIEDETLLYKILGIDEFKFTSDNIFEMLLQKMVKKTRHFFQTLYGQHENENRLNFKDAVKPDVSFELGSDVLVIPSTILSSIFYDHKRPAYMNYGSIGRIIAYKIMHGFGKSGRKVFIDDAEPTDWWTSKTSNAYDKKTQCLTQEYEKFSSDSVPSGSSTIDENVADFVSVDLAYESYSSYIKKYGPEKRLPGLHLSPEQIFWVQTGTFLCSRKPDDYNGDDSTDQEDEDEEVSSDFRVQAGLRHSKYFAKDFNCTLGSFMNPKHKCRIL